MTLSLAPDLDLPIEAVTESFGILGQRGSGKSNTGVVMAEAMSAAGLPWVAIDPKGDWWGIRAAGTGPGLPVAVLGGLHGDIPLDAGAGAEVADLIVDHNLTAVVDVSDFTLADRHRFLLSFAQRLYDRHRREPQRRHLFLEEAHEYLPQVVTGDRAKVKEALARIPLMGRSFGLGSTVMSQRSARLHKDVLTQIGTLVAMRTTGPQDRKAIAEWVEQHSVAREMLASLPDLDDGEAWVWSPRFLRVMQRVRIHRRATFDSGATPVGFADRAPATLADIDLPALTERMAAAVERANADDPKVLRARITELERQLRSAPGQVVERVEVPVIDEATWLRIHGMVDDYLTREAEHGRSREALRERVMDLVKVVGAVHAGRLEGKEGRTMRPGGDAAHTGPAAVGERTKPPRARGPMGLESEPRSLSRQTEPARPASSAPSSLKPAERAILTALAQYPQGRSQQQVSLLSGYSATSGSFSGALASLRRSGYIEGTAAALRVLPAGLDALGGWEPLPTGAGLIDYWLERLKPAERAVLRALIDSWPDAMTQAEVSATAGYSATSGSFSGALAKLRKLDLITGTAAALRASDDIAEHR